MSNELSSDLKEHLESWTQIQNEFETIKTHNDSFEIIISSLKEECKASRASEKSLSSLVNDLRKQIVDTIQEKFSIENELKKKIETLNLTTQEFKRYEKEKKELSKQIEILKNDLRRQAATFKDEKELMQSHYLIQISDLKEEIIQIKNEKSIDLNNTIQDYENKISRLHLPVQQLEENNSNLQQRLQEKEMENSILTQNLKQKQLEILGLKTKLGNMEQTYSTINQQKTHNSYLNNNQSNTSKHSESKNNEIMPHEKTSNRMEAPLNVVFNQANKKIPPFYKKINSTFTPKNIGKKKTPVSEKASFNNGCVLSTNTKIMLKPLAGKSSEKRNFDRKENENEPPVKKLLPHFSLPKNNQETDDNRTNKKKAPKKRALFSHSGFNTEEPVLLNDDSNNE